MMKFLRLGKTPSRVFVVIYLFCTLLWRFLVEPQLNGNAFVSVAVGAFLLLFLWALIKSKYLSPKWFWFEEQ